MTTDLVWHTEKRKIKDLKNHPKNPRQITKEQMEEIKTSLGNFNYVEVVAINLDNTILAGHMRIRAMKEMGRGKEEIDVRVPSRMLMKEEADEYLIRSNKNTGEWDFDILGNEWDVETLLKCGFKEEDLIGPQIEDLGSTDDEEEASVPDSPKQPITQLGDLYQLGEHRLICGDSTMPDVVESVMGGNEPNLMVTDPPYGVSYDATWRDPNKLTGSTIKRTKPIGRIKVENDDRADWSIAYSLFTGNIAYIWHEGKNSANVAKNLEDSNYDIVCQIIWNKHKFALSRGDYHWKHEPCWYAIRKGANHNWKGDRKQSTVWDIPNLTHAGNEDSRTEHSTQKPLECMARPIQNHTEKDEYVYDPFLGSGTTLIACEKLNRKCIGIELSPNYCDVIVKRYINYISKQGLNPVIYKNGELINIKEFTGETYAS